jgi:predicted RND superfamily exporter protein
VAILITSLVLAAGCAVVGFAQVKIVSRFGLLLGITLITALVGELLLTPAMLLRFGPGARR